MPILPAGSVLLVQDFGPLVVAVGEQHARVQIVEIGSSLGRGQRGLADVEHAFHERLPSLNQLGGLIGFVVLEGVFGVTVDGRQLFHSLAVPGFLGRIGSGWRQRFGRATGEQGGGYEGGESHCSRISCQSMLRTSEYSVTFG